MVGWVGFGRDGRVYRCGGRGGWFDWADWDAFIHGARGMDEPVCPMPTPWIPRPNPIHLYAHIHAKRTGGPAKAFPYTYIQHSHDYYDGNAPAAQPRGRETAVRPNHVKYSPKPKLAVTVSSDGAGSTTGYLGPMFLLAWCTTAARCRRFVGMGRRKAGRRQDLCW